jgi:hypothetical protein
MRSRISPALLLAASASAAAAEPRPGVAAAYSSIFGQSSERPTGLADGTVQYGHGHGSYPIVRLRLRSARNGRPVAEATSPADHDGWALHIQDLGPEDPPRGAWAEAAHAHNRLEAAVSHHRPPTLLELYPGRRVRVTRPAATRRFETCARRLLTASIDRMTALAREPFEQVSQGRRRVVLEPASLQPRGARLLLRLLMLPLPTVASGRWSESQRRLDEGREDDDRPSQFAWNSDQVRLYGREAGLEVDLMRDRRSPAARICRSLQLERAGAPVADRCTIGGFLDSRDGWPIRISVSRTIEAPRGGASMSVTFRRLAPLQGFAAPENPCPA